MEPDAESVKEMVTSEGIDLVGVADAGALILSYPPRPAESLLPTARSVVVMAVGHSIGAVNSPYLRLWTRNKMETSRLLDRTSEKVGRFLERKGYLSLPISADKPVEIYRRDPETGGRLRYARVAGQLSLKHTAVSAGMGEIGRSNLFLSEEFGPHQRLGAVVTEAALTPDASREPGLCEECGKCDEACPVGALNDGTHDVDRCFNYWSTGLKLMRPSRAAEVPPYLRMLLREARSRVPFVEISQNFITDVDYCIECMKACPAGCTRGVPGP